MKVKGEGRKSYEHPKQMTHNILTLEQNVVLNMLELIIYYFI